MFSFLIFIIVLAVIITAVSNSSGSGSVTKSTVQREALPRGSAVETKYFTDELDWIRNQTTLTAGMKNFYNLTGVQPYLYITDTVNGSHYPKDADAESFAQAKYDELFSDEAHLLLIFFEYESSNYHTWYLCGSQAKSVLDDEAMDILLDYIDRYYSSNLTEDEFFSKVFDEAGKRIMTVTASPWIPVLVVACAAVIVAVLFIWWNNAKKQKNLEAEQNEKILQTPLDLFGDGDIQDLTKKYDDPKNNN